MSADIWSSTDFPYMCLKDEPRTMAFRRAIETAVRPGMRVVDVGSGTGILALFAAAAGAAEVHAVEIDPMLAAALRHTAACNGFADVIRVVEGDAAAAELPAADVVIAELIDTALLDELQVPVLNSLRARGVVTDATRVIPGVYRTYLELVRSDQEYYGFQIRAPKHEWPFYAQAGQGWHDTSVEVMSDRVLLGAYDFEAGAVAPEQDSVVSFSTLAPGANAVRISGEIGLVQGMVLGPTNAVNGDKILPLDLVERGATGSFRVSFAMGRGLGTFKMEAVPAP